MTNPYGPWATAIDAGRYPQLSAFWRQRLTMLVPTSQTSPLLSRRNLLGLFALAAVIGFLPTFRAAPAVAEQEKLPQEKSSDQTAAGKPEPNAKIIRGKVIDESGKPLAGAELCLPVFSPERHVLQAKSDFQGRFALEVPAAWIAEKQQPWLMATTLWAYMAGHQLGTTQVYLAGGATDATIQLGPAADSRFVVLDPQGQPCSGALVEPYPIKTTMSYQSPPEELLPRLGARTDAEGRVSLPAASQETMLNARITSKEFGIQLQRTEKTKPSTIAGETIRLRPVGKIVGRMLADRPEMVRGVRLAFTTSPIRLRIGGPLWPTEEFADVTTDTEGRFVVPAMAAGRLHTDVSVDEKQPLRPKLLDTIKVDADKTTEVQIPMVSTVVVRGSIRTQDTGRPISGALIYVYYGIGRQGASVASDADGKYTARVLPGRVGLQVTFVPNKYAYVQMGEPWLRPYQVPEDAKEFDLPPVEVVPSKTIAGRVIDQQDQPVANSQVSILEGNRRYGFGKSDNNGRFNLTGVPATIDPAKATYQVSPETGSTGPSATEVITSDPLLLRTTPRPTRVPAGRSPKR
jgi:protocatechuate 3,4-dioxygenase beta subunit